jgi:protein PsiE
MPTMGEMPMPGGGCAMPGGAGGAAVRCWPAPARPADAAYVSSTAATAVPEDAERLSGPAHPCEYPNRQGIPALPRRRVWGNWMSDGAGARTARRLRSAVDPIGNLLTEGFHLIALFAIGAATVWAAVHTFAAMLAKGDPKLEDLLLLFIYLEIGSMVGIYFRTNHMPVRFLIYVAITALTRHMIVVVQIETAPELSILILAAGTFVLALAVLVIRYASFHYPSGKGADSTEDA